MAAAARVTSGPMPSPGSSTMVFFMVVPVPKQNSGKPRGATRYKIAPFWRGNFFFISRKVQATGDDSAAIAVERRRITSWAMATMSRERTCLD